METERSETHVEVSTDGANAVDLLHERSGLSKQQVKSAMTSGAVWITRGRKTRRLRRATRELAAGDELHLYYDPEVLAETPVAPHLVADVGDYSVWNKPCGLRSQGSRWGDHCTVSRWAERHLEPQRPAFIVHRLDRAANGLIVVAHGKRTAANLSGQFRERQVEKRYRAAVAGDLAGQAEPLLIEVPIDDKAAVSEVSLLRSEADRSLVEVRTRTGRKHQVRRHLADAGYPIVGDRLYGTGGTDTVDLQLTASYLAFRCPVTGERVEYALEDTDGAA